jgi:thiol-disulfide isomerase/thioredoxin
MKIPSFAVVAAALLPATFALGETVSDIVNKFEGQKAEALEAYLKANPDAEDNGAALDFLVEAYDQLGESAKVPVLLQRKYDLMPKGKEMELGEAIPTVQRLFQAYAEAGQKDKARDLIASVKMDIGDHEEADKVASYLDRFLGQLDQPGVGDQMEIAFTSLQGDKVDLADMKGKVVLVDFWATWCGPCIGELPNVQKAYKAFHDKGFEIIAISLDKEDDKEKLEQFIKDKEMPWPQAFDGLGWETPLVRQYGIQGIPATFLVGKDGKIVATNLRGPALEAELAKLLDK